MLARTAFLAALAVLALNDHVLKAAFPGLVTGKLSDFAGVFALAGFLALALPRFAACTMAGALFVWWKSPLSQTFIDALPWQATRVVDWTDLAALAMLPLAYRLLPRERALRPQHAAIAMLSLAAFVATSVDRYRIPVPYFHGLRTIETGSRRPIALERLQRCGFEVLDQSPEVFTLVHRSSAVRVPRELRARVTIHERRRGVVLEVKSISGSPDEAEHEALLADLLGKLRRCYGK